MVGQITSLDQDNFDQRNFDQDNFDPFVMVTDFFVIFFIFMFRFAWRSGNNGCRWFFVFRFIEIIRCIVHFFLYKQKLNFFFSFLFFFEKKNRHTMVVFYCFSTINLSESVVMTRFCISQHGAIFQWFFLPCFSYTVPLCEANCRILLLWRLQLWVLSFFCRRF